MSKLEKLNNFKLIPCDIIVRISGFHPGFLELFWFLSYKLGITLQIIFAFAFLLPECLTSTCKIEKCEENYYVSDINGDGEIKCEGEYECCILQI